MAEPLLDRADKIRKRDDRLELGTAASEQKSFQYVIRNSRAFKKACWPL